MADISIDTIHEYEYVKGRGHEPLVLPYVFDMKPEVRYQVILGKWPVYNRKNTMKFYRWYWDNYPGPRKCEECGLPLLSYSAVYVSHILTRGSWPFPEVAYDPRNINLLCYDHHNHWERTDLRKTMRIFASNQLRIEQIQAEFVGTYPGRR